MEAPLCGGWVSMCEVLSKFPFLYYSGAKATAPKEVAALGRGNSVQSWSHSIPGRDRSTTFTFAFTGEPSHL